MRRIKMRSKPSTQQIQLGKVRIVVAAFVMVALFITMATYAEPQTNEKPASACPLQKDNPGCCAAKDMCPAQKDGAKCCKPSCCQKDKSAVKDSKSDQESNTKSKPLSCNCSPNCKVAKQNNAACPCGCKCPCCSLKS